MMQQNHMKDSLLTSNEIGAKTTAHINGQSNGNTKIVLVSNETLEIDNRNRSKSVTTSNVNDEELTPLTWLHDKNLLKGTVRFSILFIT